MHHDSEVELLMVFRSECATSIAPGEIVDMPRVKGADAVYEVADLWRERCLTNDKSLLWPDEETWTVSNIERMAELLSDKETDESSDFFVRTRARMTQDSVAIHHLFADLTVVWSLMAGAYRPSTKMSWLADDVMKNSPADPSIMSLAEKAFETRIAANEREKGLHAPRRTRQMRLFLEFARRLKVDRLDPHDLNACYQLAMSIYPRIPASDNAQDMILHLLFPDNFEPITSRKTKQAIVDSFPELVSVRDNIDREIAQVRAGLANRLDNGVFQFLDKDVIELWQAASTPEKLLPTSINAPSPPTALHMAFDSFRADSVWSLAVELRQRRASEIRELVTLDTDITLDAFNREIWLLDTGSRIISSGKSVGNIDDHLTAEDIVDIRRAIASDDLQLHGNFVWKPAAGKFGVMLTAADPLLSIQGAIAALLDKNLTPLEKVARIVALPGFGESTATGLVMLMHPTEFAIYNKQSMAAFDSLGLQHETLDIFEDGVRSLLAEVGAADFLELDAFLYLVAQGKIEIAASTRNQWLFQWNPAKYDFMADLESMSVGDTDDWLTTAYRNDMQPGDPVLFWQSGNNAGIYATGEISGQPFQREAQVANSGLEWAIDFQLTGKLSEPIRRQTILQHPILKNMGVIKFANATNFRVTDEEWQAVQELISDNDQSMPSDKPTIQDLADITHLDAAELGEIEFLLARKKQIIFEGPPGAGKTFLAELFARYFTRNPLEGAPNEQIEIVQFHQSYGYEDFVQGIRPVTDEAGHLQYRVMPGIFLSLCDRATANPDRPFVLIIDEINRGNLSRIFGELLMLLEYRTKTVRLPYAAGDGATGPTHLTIPDNLYLIGTMNGTDRSLSMIDYALRRRFFFYHLLPVIDGKASVLERWLSAQPIEPGDQQNVLTYFIDLNLEINRLLSPDFQIGHSYFMDPDITTDAGLERVWRHALRPLLEEYFHTARDRNEIIGKLRPSDLQDGVGESDVLSANDV